MRLSLWVPSAGALLVFRLATAATAGAEELGHWRCAANGGINVLYCYLCANGVSCSYSELLRAQTKEATLGCTAATLSQLAAKNGLSMQVASLTMNELLSCPLPVLVHMDGESPEVGAFLLLLAITDRSIHYVNGPTATLHTMDRESFRRVWSGTVLVPSSQWRWNIMLCGVGCGVGCGVVFVFRRIGRYARSKRSK